MLSPWSKSTGFDDRAIEKRIGFSAARLGRRASAVTKASAMTTASTVGPQKYTRALGDVALRMAVVPAVANAGFTSASPNAFALSKRSAGSFSSAFSSAATTFGGTCLRIALTGAASSVSIFMITCCADPPMCGGCPASISKSTVANE